MSKKSLLEAILYLSGKAMTETQLSELMGTSQSSVRRLISVLRREYEGRDSGLEIARKGRRWTLRVKEEYLRGIAHMAPTTLPDAIIKTAGLVAYYQPVKQSHLVHVLGSKAYDHVRRLRDRGLVSARPHGRTVLLTTTSKFLEFFGLENRNRKDLRKLLAKRVGALIDEGSASPDLIIST